MGATAVLSETLVVAEPGGTATLDIGVANTGSVVDQFTITVLGDAAGWATVEPATVSLLPNSHDRATLRFTIPRDSSVAAGDIAFAVKVASSEDPAGSIVEEGTLRIGAFADVFTELIPRTSRGSRAGHHDLALDNRGNTRVNAVLTGIDPDGLLRFRFDPPALVAEPGTAAFSKVTVIPRRRFMRGTPQTRPFQVLVETEGGAPLTADGSLLQLPRIPAWLAKAVLAALLLVLLLVLLWFTLLRPTVESAAKDAVEEPLAEQGAAINDLAAAQGRPAPLDKKGREAGKGNGSGSGTGAEAGQGDGGAAAGSGQAAISTDFGNPFDLRLAVDGTGVLEDEETVQEGRVFSLTDILLQNPAGDSGIIELRRNDTVLLRQALANFRDLDFHFVSPIVFDAGQRVSLRVECAGPARCTPSAYLAGFLKRK